MKQVIVIGADFTPSSLPPATRIRFFVNHLAEFGWQPLVLSTDPVHYDRAVDAENLKLLADNVEVVRTNAWSAGWTRKIGFGDVGMRSLWAHWQELARLCRTRKPDLLFLPVPPYLPMVLGRLANMRFGVPYVVDYIDPWVTEYYWQLPREQRPPKWPLAYTLARAVEPFALKRVGHITGVSQGTNDSVTERYAHLDATHTTAIPYGGETRDFEYVRAHPRLNPIFRRDDGYYHLSYVGACIPQMHQTLRAVLQAWRNGLTQEPQLFSRLRLHFVGTSYDAQADKPQALPLAEEIGVAQFVTEQPRRVAYLDSLQILLDSQGLVLFGSDEPHYTASKIFPYILAQRPVLAVFHEASSVVTILQETKAGQVLTFNEASPPAQQLPAIQAALREMLLQPAAYQPPTVWEAFAPYTTRAMAQRLAAAFEQAWLRAQPAGKNHAGK